MMVMIHDDDDDDDEPLQSPRGILRDLTSGPSAVREKHNNVCMRHSYIQQMTLILKRPRSFQPVSKMQGQNAKGNEKKL